LLQKLLGLKATLWTGLLTAIAYLAALYFEPYWQVKISLIEQVIYVIFAGGFLFSAQFSRSRFSIIISLLVCYYLIDQGYFIGKDWFGEHKKWLFLSCIFSLAYLTAVKDRGMLSIHGLLRVFGLIACSILAKIWLVFIPWLMLYIEQKNIPLFVTEQLDINLPLFLAACYMLYKSLRYPNLLVASLFTHLILLSLFSYQQLSLPLSVVFSLITLQYILVVVIDSYYLAYRDELTNLPSRRALNQYALSLGRHYCVAMLDIDHFKKFNDSYGHDIGDQVLKLVAAKLAKVKSGGRVFRYGGEEFTAIFPRKTALEAQEALEVLRQSIADYKIVIRQPVRKNKKARQSNDSSEFKSVSVTISIGVATRATKQSFEQSVKQADEALYRAKKKGRNNVSE